MTEKSGTGLPGSEVPPEATPSRDPASPEFTPSQEDRSAGFQRYFDKQREEAERTAPPNTPPSTPPETPEATPVKPETANLTQQVEMYKANLQRKFRQKALEAGVSVMALVANIPAFKDASGFIRITRAVLGTTVAGMIGGDLGKQLGLSKLSIEQGERTKQFLERTKQFFNDDGTAKILNLDEQLAAEEIRVEMSKQLEISAAVAKTTEHHKLFGKMIEEDLDKSAETSAGWSKEMLKGMATGIRSLCSKETLGKAGRLALKVTNPKNVAWGTVQLAKAGAKNWRTLAWMGASVGAAWLAPVAAPLILTSIGVGKKAGHMRELYKAHGAAEERVGTYQRFSLERVTSANELADRILKLDRAMGKADVPDNVEALLQEVLESVNQDTYRDVARAVRQAAFEGAGAGIALGTVLYGASEYYRQHEQPTTASASAKLSGGSPTQQPGEQASPYQRDPAEMHKQNIEKYQQAPIEGRSSGESAAEPYVAGNAEPYSTPPAESFQDKDTPAEPYEKPGQERIEVDKHMHVDVNGDGSTETAGLKEDYLIETDKASGRLIIKMPYMDTNGDGKFDDLKLSPEDTAKGIKEKFVKVFVDQKTGNGGFLGQEIHVMNDGTEKVQGTLWVGDKDEWMRSQVGTDKWNQVRDVIKGSVGPNGHETKGWGFVARRGPMASLEVPSMDGLSGKALETAIRDQVPEIQITQFNEVANTFSGNWLGLRGFQAEFAGGIRLSSEEIGALTQGWSSDETTTFETTQQQFAYADGSFRFKHFEVPAEKFKSFTKALLYNPAGLPTELKEALRAIHEQKSVASEPLLEALKGLKKKQFTIEDLVRAAKAAKQIVLSRKG